MKEKVFVLTIPALMLLGIPHVAKAEPKGPIVEALCRFAGGAYGTCSFLEQCLLEDGVPTTRGGKAACCYVGPESFCTEETASSDNPAKQPGLTTQPGKFKTPKVKQPPVRPGVRTPSGAITKPKATRQPAKPGTMKPLRGESGQGCTDPAARSIDFRIVNKASRFKGRVEITGTIKNVGRAAYETRPNQQSMHLYEGSRLVKQQAFGNLPPGRTAAIRYQRNWASSSPAEGEFPPTYKLMIIYDPDITKDGNPKNDDCVATNNKKERSGAAINGLFR